MVQQQMNFSLKPMLPGQQEVQFLSALILTIKAISCWSKLSGGGPGQPNAGAVSVYSDIDVAPMDVTADNTNQTTSCWIVYNPKNSCVYTTNNGGSSISAFLLKKKKKKVELELIDAVAATLNNPLDMALSHDYKYLYALASGHH